MRVLIVKTSSLGDLIHTLPAITDAKRIFGDQITFDWVAESSFADIPSWHPAVEQIIPVAIRQWRRRPLRSLGAVGRSLKKLRACDYGAVIDAQGLWKSAILTRLARGPRHGYAKACSREAGQWAYQKQHVVPWGQHAVTRIRQLMALALGYECPTDQPDYGIKSQFTCPKPSKPYIVLIHATSWPSKLWPLEFWQRLAHLITQSGLQVKLPHGCQQEYERARQIAGDNPDIEVMARLPLTAIAQTLAASQGCVAVDTGIGHLAAALELPCVSIYGPTDPAKTGTYGRNQQHHQALFACAPCFNKNCTHPDQHHAPTPPCYRQITPESVWRQMAATL